MPIVKIEKSIELQFGTGDIDVMPGLLDQDMIVGAICFTQRERTPIGTVQHHDPYISREMEATPVRLTFSKVESIDVLIRSLESAKRYMLNGQLDWDHKEEADTAQPTAPWNTISQKPADAGYYLVSDGENIGFGHYLSDGSWFAEDYAPLLSADITHWMPLPSIPIAQGEDKPNERE